MKPIRNLLSTLLIAGAVSAATTGSSVASAADDTTTTQPLPSQGQQEGHHHGGPWRLLGRLDLSAAQKLQIKEIWAAAQPQMQTLREQIQANSLKLRQTLPTDPSYDSIVLQVSQTHGTLAAQMMTKLAQLRAQVYQVLTPAQQGQLATLEAEMRNEHGPWGGPHEE